MSNDIKKDDLNDSQEGRLSSIFSEKSTARDGSAGIYSSIKQTHIEKDNNMNRSMGFTTSKDNSKLEEKIKELQINLASLPQSFSRPKSKSNYSNNGGQAPYYKNPTDESDLKN